MAECSVEGCDRRARLKGLCKAHYQRLLRTGSTRPDEPLRKVRKRKLGLKLSQSEGVSQDRADEIGDRAGEGTPDERLQAIQPFMRLLWADALGSDMKWENCADCGETHRTVAEALACDEAMEAT